MLMHIKEIYLYAHYVIYLNIHRLYLKKIQIIAHVYNIYCTNINKYRLTGKRPSGNRQSGKFSLSSV